jgi:hypothetical protein
MALFAAALAADESNGTINALRFFMQQIIAGRN